ncbi:MAG: hypothetical protein WDO73_33155 [Ignavibacteriota bacterium]
MVRATGALLAAGLWAVDVAVAGFRAVVAVAGLVFLTVAVVLTLLVGVEVLVGDAADPPAQTTVPRANAAAKLGSLIVVEQCSNYLE